MLLLLAGLLVAPLASADIFKCVDSTGHVTYTNARALGKGCSTLAHDQAVSMVPGAGRPVAPSAPAASTAAGFPRVDANTQKARDTDRRRILEEELATEQRALVLAQKQLAEQQAQRGGDERNFGAAADRLQPFRDKAQLHERNVEALKREIGSLR